MTQRNHALRPSIYRFIASVFIGLSISGMAASAQVTANEPVVSLNGTWSFKTLKGAAEIPKWVHPDSSSTEGWDQLPVPGNWDVEQAYEQFRGMGLYRREIFLPEDLRGRNLRICFEAVNESAQVFINGNYVGSHRGGYTPFEFRIDDLVNYGRDNTIAVVADNSYSRGAWWAWGGLSRGVSIKGSQALRISALAVTPKADVRSRQGHVQLRYQLQGNDGQAHQLRIRMVVRPLKPKAGQQADTLSAVVEFPAGTRNYEGYLNLSVADSIKLWHFDFPNLYRCELYVYEGNNLLSRKESRFGFRSVEVKNNQVFLNGEAVRLFGFNRVHDHRAFGNTEPIALIKQDIDHMKSMGCNMTRMMHAPLSPDLLNYADSVGMLIIEEIPVWGREDPQAFEDNPVTRQWLRELVARDYNHPSVIGWSVANELVLDIKDWRRMRMSGEHYRYIASMIRYVKELDSTRLVTYVSLSAFRDSVTVGQEPAKYADIISFNNYGDFVKAATVIHQKWPDKAVLVTEFGLGQIGYGIDSALPEGLLTKVKQLAALKYIAGASLWSYNDYRSNYVGTHVGGDRTWGVVDVWRQEKRAAQQIRDTFAPIAGMKAEWNARQKQMEVSLEPRKTGDLPSFTLRQYTLRMQWYNPAGKLLQQVSSPLATISPGQETVHHAFTYSRSMKQVAYIQVQLVSPTGYAVAEHTLHMQKAAKPVVRQILSSDSAVRLYLGQLLPGTVYQVLLPGADTLRTMDTYLDIPRGKLPQQAKATLQMVNRAGASAPQPLELRFSGQPLPPVVRALVPVADGLVVGYGYPHKVATYTIQYRTAKDPENTGEKTSSTEGSVKIKGLPDGPMEIRIKAQVKDNSSQWSPWTSIKR